MYKNNIKISALSTMITAMTMFVVSSPITYALDYGTATVNQTSIKTKDTYASANNSAKISTAKANINNSVANSSKNSSKNNHSIGFYQTHNHNGSKTVSADTDGLQKANGAIQKQSNSNSNLLHQQDNKGFYARIGLGMALPMKITENINYFNVQKPANTFYYGGGLGYRIHPMLRLDASVHHLNESKFKQQFQSSLPGNFVVDNLIHTYQQNPALFANGVNISSTTGPVQLPPKTTIQNITEIQLLPFHATATQSFKSTVVLANAYVDLLSGEGYMNRIVPYVGGGIGVTHHNVSDLVISTIPRVNDKNNNYDAKYTFKAQSTNTFAYALEGGLACKLNDNALITVSYKYLDSGKAIANDSSLDQEVSMFGMKETKTFDKTEYTNYNVQAPKNKFKANIVEVGLRYNF